eukprot:TRINITY_DN25367_c0_g2_i1.p1 TRINITY_DN25367_c0_g2~~TRINITY_DN25367_c0_g2_i1.p1  ORF type:complete len:545 (-),score=52.15 TRINITY_DN25367_c0_g2_i1:252-1712(-)
MGLFLAALCPFICCIIICMKLSHDAQGRTVRLDGTVPPSVGEREEPEWTAAARRSTWRLRLEGIVEPRLRQFGNSFGVNLSMTSRRSFGAQSASSRSTSFATRGRNAELKRAELLTARRRDLAGSEPSMPGHLYIKVAREHLVEQSLRCLASVPATELLAKNLHVHYDGEQGVDLGGLAKDWMDCVASALSQAAETADGHLINLSDNSLAPRPRDRRLEDLLAIGRLAGLALWFGIPLPIALSHVACKFLLDVPVSTDDIRRLDPEFYQYRLEPILKPGGVATMQEALGEPLTFMSAATDLRPSTPLCRGGAEKVVTEENKLEYLQLLCEYYLCGESEQQIKMVLQGFWDIFPKDSLLAAGLTARELSLLIVGYPSLDVDDWKAHTVFHVGEAARVSFWFWEILGDMDMVDRAKVLHFATGSSRLPASGFSTLKPTFHLSVRGDPDQLPHAHTCGNKLVLPEYTSRDQLLEKLRIALDNDTGFGFA